MNPYSQHLRELVLAAIEAGEQTQKAIAGTLSISLSTVEKWWRRKRETGKVTPLPQSHGPQRTLQGCAPFIRAEVKKQADITLAELCARVAAVEKVQASPSMMCRELKHLRLPRKKSRSTIASGTHRGSSACAGNSPNGSPRNGASYSRT